MSKIEYYKNRMNLDGLISDYNSGILTKQKFFETLLEFVKVSYIIVPEKIRVIKILDEIHRKNTTTPKIFEKLLISDKDYIVRKVIADIIPKYALSDRQELYKQVISTEMNPQVISALLESIKEFDENNFELVSDLLIQRYLDKFKVTPEECRFFWDLDRYAFKRNAVGSLKFLIGKTRDDMKANCEYPIYLLENGHIKGLNLSNYSLEKLPSSIANLSKLSYLNLNNVGLSELPDSMKFLKCLKRVWLRYVSLRTVPNFLLKIAEGRYAQKYVNSGVTSKEASVLGLFQILAGHKLRKESVKNNKIDSRWAFYYKLNTEGHIVALGAYDYEECVVNTFPQQISLLKHLQELYLKWNCIEFIPKSLESLGSLKILDLEDNIIKKVPENLFNLQNLEVLNLSANRLKEIPPQIVNLKSLKILNLSDNQIEGIPAKMLPFLNSLESFLI